MRDLPVGLLRWRGMNRFGHFLFEVKNQDTFNLINSSQIEPEGAGQRPKVAQTIGHRLGQGEESGHFQWLEPPGLPETKLPHLKLDRRLS